MIEGGISVKDALNAGVAQTTIDQIFTSPQLDTSLITSDNVSILETNPGVYTSQAQLNESAASYMARIMADGVIDATERNNMLQIATSEGVTFDDLLNSAVDANIMFNTTCPAGQVFDQATQQCVADGTDPRPCPDGTAYNATTNTCDPITTTDPRPCPDGTAYNATTNTCDPITTTGCTNADGSPKTCAEGFTLDASCNCIRDACPTGQELFNGVCVPICPTGFTRNAAGVCQENITVCEDGYTLNPVTGNCVPNNSIPDCGTGEKYNPATGQCEKIFVNTQEEYVTPTVYQPLPDNTGVYAAGEESLDTTFRESAPRTEVLDSYGNLTNFDYTPAASLRSATGSGYNWTPPTVTGRPRSLMGADLLARYTGGRAAADLRQLTTGLGNGRTYSDYTGVLQNPGSYGGGLSKSQLYSRMRGLDYQRDNAAAADRQASAARGGISAYLAANPDIAASYESQSQKGQLGGQSLEQFARNHYNTTGRAEMSAGNEGSIYSGGKHWRARRCYRLYKRGGWLRG
jgi:hypothetical protein